MEVILDHVARITWPVDSMADCAYHSDIMPLLLSSQDLVHPVARDLCSSCCLSIVMVLPITLAGIEMPIGLS